jgi:hypothetical protein
MDLVNAVIYGTLLGDGSIGRDKTTYFLKISHKLSQLPYLEWKAKIVGYNHDFQDYVSGYGSKMKSMKFYDRNRLEPIYNTCVINGEKQITQEWIDHLSIISLAIWYQDDGSWGKCGNKIGNDRRQRRANFSVCSFNELSCNLLIKWLKDDFNLKARHVIRKGKYPMLELYHASTIKLWKLVAPYLILKTKLDLSKKSWSDEYWIDHSIIGIKAKELFENFQPPERKKAFHYNYDSKNLRNIIHNGQTLHLNEWARQTGIKRETIAGRIKRGWTIEAALTK